MSKKQTMYNAVHQAVSRAAKALKGNDHDESFQVDLEEDFFLSRQNIHVRQLSIEGELFPTFQAEGKVS